MPDQRVRHAGPVVSRALPGLLLVLLCLLTVIWLAPDFASPEQDSAWALALNQAVGDRLAFGRDIIFNLGPWGAVYTGQYHPATDRMMLAGGAIIALAIGSGLAALARGGRRWATVLLPLLIATVGLRDPVFVVLPLLLLAVAVSLGQPASLASAIPPNTAGVAALLLLTAACALLSLVKSTFGTQALLMTALAVLALAAGRQVRLAGIVLALYAASSAGFWLAAGQRLADLPAFFAAVPLLISGYTEGLAKSGPWSDIAAFLGGAAVLLGLLWRDRSRRRPLGNALLLLGLLFTLFVAFKAGFVRHDEHALIAAGSLAMAPLVLANALRARALALAAATSLCVLVFVAHRYPGYEWPSVTRGATRLASAASGAWTRVSDPGRLSRRFEADMARVSAGRPLPHVTGPTDIYSSGQVILLANGLEWSPRPALQSVTVTSAGVAQADLDPLEGVDGARPPVQNVFFRVEDEDGRLPSTQDGLSWPVLLSKFRVEEYDRGQDMALLRRQPGAPAAEPSGPALLDGEYRLGQDVPLPVLPGGLGWATLDARPTLLGRLASFLFRPPALFITVRYADGPVERFRLLSDLARSGFLLTPRVSSTEDMLWLLLPERRGPEHRPISVALGGESGTSWLWRPRFGLRLQAMHIPIQGRVRDMLLSTPQPTAPSHDPPARMADACAIDAVDAKPASAQALAVQGSTRVSGWFVASITARDPPDRILVRMTDSVGQSWMTAAPQRYRPDVAGYFVNPTLVRSGFDAMLDLSGLAGAYTLTLEAERGEHRWTCKIRQDLVIDPPRKG